MRLIGDITKERFSLRTSPFILFSLVNYRLAVNPPLWLYLLVFFTMGVFSEHPYTSITTTLDQITALPKDQSDDVIESTIAELINSILISTTGQYEAARIIRKKLKYGSLNQHINALKVLDLIVGNGGPSLSQFYHDQKLIDRLRIDTRSTEKQVQRLAIRLIVGWKEHFEGEKAYAPLVQLFYSCKLSKSKRAVPDFMNDQVDQTPFEEYYEDEDVQSMITTESLADEHIKTYQTNKELDRKFKIPKINYIAEKPRIQKLIAEAMSSATILKNSLETLKDGELSVDNDKCVIEFGKCRQIRRKVLRYLQLVDLEDLVGPLIHANEELVAALSKYEEKATDSDSLDEYEDYDEGEDVDESNDDLSEQTEIEDSLSKLDISHKKAPPPIPSKNSAPEPNNPFSDPFSDGHGVGGIVHDAHLPWKK